MATQMSKPLWWELPRELHLMIAKQVAEEEYSEKKTVAGYATVDRQWQVIVEQATMRELKVSNDDLTMFESIFTVVRRRRYIRHIGLEFKFINSIETVDNRNWSSRMCDRSLARLHREMHRQNMETEDATTWHARQISFEITNTIYWFINYTNCWKRSEVSRLSICLELISENRSYCQQLARRLIEYDEEVLDGTYPDSLDKGYRAFLYESASRDFNRQAEWDHSWEDSLDALAMPFLAFESLAADFIRGISLSVNNARYISPYVVSKLAKQLPSIEYIDWHYKARFCTRDQHDKLMDEQIAAVEQLPATIKNLCLRQVGHGQSWSPHTNQQAYFGNKRGELAGALAALAARQLEKLSVTCAIDALDFFNLAGRQTMWPMLKHLTLTTSCFDDEEPSSFEPWRTQQIQAVIHKAGRAALRMPQLKVFSLTNANLDGGVGVSVYFSFRVHEYEPQEFTPSFAILELLADEDNDHATSDVLTRLSLKKWREVANWRCLDLTLKVGCSCEVDEDEQWSLTEGTLCLERLQDPAVRKRG
ncbi:hypothetical protein PspLS_04570 [Pyricularia sp. CBS 133598]|nr:hypothetical protein PspLS_04570 [Pyricularia sp. CBS 133598]